MVVVWNGVLEHVLARARDDLARILVLGMLAGGLILARGRGRGRLILALGLHATKQGCVKRTKIRRWWATRNRQLRQWLLLLAWVKIHVIHNLQLVLANRLQCALIHCLYSGILTSHA